MTVRTALAVTALTVGIAALNQDSPSRANARASALPGALSTARTPARTPVVVELFTSEGCSSCPPADALLQRLLGTQPVAGAEIIGLGEHVDYWDELGWKDRFSSATLTNRQRLYASRFGIQSVYTPQMVVDGRTEIVGSDAGAARRALERALAVRHGVVQLRVESGPGRVAVDVTASDLPAPGRGDRADIVVAVIEDGLRSDVKRGENHGRVLTHAAVVRELKTIGEASADIISSAHTDVPLAPEWQREQLKVVALVQERRGRTILASAVAPLAGR